jgi:hypothetical protein
MGRRKNVDDLFKNLQNLHKVPAGGKAALTN